MGMTMSSADGRMQGRIRALAGSYVDLEKHVGQANEWARHCPTTVQLRFRVLLHEDDATACECIPFTWTLEDVVKIEARKLRRHDESIIDTPQTLSVGQFYSMYCYLSDIHDCASRRSAVLTAASPNTFSSHLLDEVDMDSECQICMDAANEVVLPCTHSFCQRCFRSWHAHHDTCPTCRRTLPPQHSDDCKELWHLATIDPHDLTAYIQDLVAQALCVLDRW